MKITPLTLPARDAAEDAARHVTAGPSFPWPVKALATVLVAAVLAVGSRALAGLPPQRTPAVGDWLFLLVVSLVVAGGYWGILTSRTFCDGVSIRQSWLWPRQVAIADITQLRLVSVPGLHWLIVPRLVVRTAQGVTVFHAGDPAVLARFRTLALGR